MQATQTSQEPASRAAPRPRVLIAGTPEAIDTLRRVLGGAAEILAARSTDEALARLGAGVDLLVCNVRFDESRMFAFLQAVKSDPRGRGIPVICCRVSLRELAPGVSHAIRMALEALGIRAFVDSAQLCREHGAAGAAAALRDAILSELPAR